MPLEYLTDYIAIDKAVEQCAVITLFQGLYSYIRNSLSNMQHYTLDYQSTTSYSTELIGDISKKSYTMNIFSPQVTV